MRVSEIFRSLQGEGGRIGAPTVFVRLAGCNLRCSWCDTMYAQERDSGTEMQLREIIDKVVAFKCPEVCVTGGEPMLQVGVIELLHELLDEGFYVTLETNGSISLEELPCEEHLIVSMDVKCPSSGEAGKSNLANLDMLGPTDQLKFVVADERDYLFAKKLIEERKPMCNVILTPVGGRELRWLAEAVLRDGLDVRVLPQLHKLIWGDARGH